MYYYNVLESAKSLVGWCVWEGNERTVTSDLLCDSVIIEQS